MTGVGRLLSILVGYIVAVLAAAAFLAALFFSAIPLAPDTPSGFYAGGILGGFVFFAPLVGSISFMPAVCVIAATEVFRLRDWLFHALGGGLVGMLGAVWLWTSPQRSPLPPDAGFLAALAGAGMVGGIAYWLIAGRKAGMWPDADAPG